MGEGRYFTARGAHPQGGHDLNDGVRRHAASPDLYDDAAWSQAQWPGHDADPHDAYRLQAAPVAQPERSVPNRAEPRVSAAGYGQPQPYPQQPYMQAPGTYPQELPRTDARPHYASSYAEEGAYPAPQSYAQPDAYAGYTTYAQPAPTGVPPVSVGGMARGFGAVMSLVLLIGGGVWTWQMMQRDVSGVPVVRALEGPLRVAPEDPGGMQAAHQGLSVNELAAEGASGLPDEIVLAPQPLDLDSNMSRPTQTVAPILQGDTLIEVGLPVPGSELGAATAPALGFVTPNRSAVTSSPRPPGRSAQVARPAAQPGAATAGSLADTALAAAVANSVAADLSRAGGVDVDPASIGPGTRLVQLGTYDSAAEARTAWDMLAQRFNPLLNDRGRVIEAAHSGGSVFYRLRAHGFSDDRDARRFCAALIDQRLDCIPVLIR